MSTLYELKRMDISLSAFKYHSLMKHHELETIWEISCNQKQHSYFNESRIHANLYQIYAFYRSYLSFF